MKTNRLLVAALLAILWFGGPAAFADVVTDWNTVMTQALKSPVQPPPVQSRITTMVHLGMFDAVNGIVRKYEPYLAFEDAPPGARAEAAGIEAAYTILSALLPAHQAAYDAQRAASLAALSGNPEESESILRGRAWGVAVAQALLAHRANDGTSVVLPPPAGSTAPGYWRHPSREPGPNAGLNFLVVTPFLVTNIADFDPGPPYGIADRTALLASAVYAADVNEVQARGSAGSGVRTADETSEALFIHACDASDMNRLLCRLVPSGAKLVDNARLFALFNATGFDTTIAIFRSKYAYELWRPYQAIRNADLDDNPATVKDAAWVPLRPTPSHPEYISGHSAFLPSLLRVAARELGDTQAIEVSTPSFPQPRIYNSLEAFALATIDARVDLGVHYRETCEVSVMVGQAVADQVVETALPLQHDRGR